MKRLFSFFFLILILLNTVGYYEVLVLLEKQNYDEAVQKIKDNENQISGNLLLKIPMPSRFNEDDREYRKATGEINIADTRYYSRRINMYPGPGILPGDGRSGYVSLGVKI